MIFNFPVREDQIDNDDDEKMMIMKNGDDKKMMFMKKMAVTMRTIIG